MPYQRPVAATCSSDLMIAVVKMVAAEAQSLWEKTSSGGRLGAIGVGGGLLFFGTKGAGIAALGTAIGVPLWVVFGAGGAFLGVLYDELNRKRD